MNTSMQGAKTNGYLFGPGPAWFAYAMTVALMIVDYVDRQVIVSMFPYLKAEWNLSDKELGLLVSIISITVAVFGIPVAWIADRFGRVKSIVVMARGLEPCVHILHVQRRPMGNCSRRAPSSGSERPATVRSAPPWWRPTFLRECAPDCWAVFLRPRRSVRFWE